MFSQRFYLCSLVALLVAGAPRPAPALDDTRAADRVLATARVVDDMPFNMPVDEVLPRAHRMLDALGHLERKLLRELSTLSPSRRDTTDRRVDYKLRAVRKAREALAGTHVLEAELAARRASGIGDPVAALGFLGMLSGPTIALAKVVPPEIGFLVAAAGAIAAVAGQVVPSWSEVPKTEIASAIAKLNARLANSGDPVAGSAPEQRRRALMTHLANALRDPEPILRQQRAAQRAAYLVRIRRSVGTAVHGLTNHFRSGDRARRGRQLGTAAGAVD